LDTLEEVIKEVIDQNEELTDGERCPTYEINIDTKGDF